MISINNWFIAITLQSDEPLFFINVSPRLTNCISVLHGYSLGLFSDTLWALSFSFSLSLCNQLHLKIHTKTSIRVGCVVLLRTSLTSRHVHTLHFHLQTTNDRIIWRKKNLDLVAHGNREKLYFRRYTTLKNTRSNNNYDSPVWLAENCFDHKNWSGGLDATFITKICGNVLRNRHVFWEWS